MTKIERTELKTFVVTTISKKVSALDSSWLVDWFYLFYNFRLVIMAFLVDSWVITIGIALMTWLAYENSGNDISKSISTLVSGGITSYRFALLSGSIATLLGTTVSALD